MTKDEALKMAIEAMDWELGGEPLPTLMEKARKACKDALEQPAQEPINLKCKSVQKRLATQWGYVKQYAQEPAPSWQGLSDDEIQAIRIKTFDAVATNYEAYRAIEQALKDKNS